MKVPTYLEVVHGVDRNGKPLLTVKNLPGEGAELYPAHARAYAHALLQAADDCEKPWPLTLKRRNIQRNEHQRYALSSE